jgi:ABC-type glycerol-3-phosphate transport system substrate-binding protein
MTMIGFRTVLAALLAGGLASGPAAAASLVVYTAQPSDQIAEAVEAFRKEHPGVKVELPVSSLTIVPSDAMLANDEHNKRRFMELLGG